jgi:hypothetical protein
VPFHQSAKAAAAFSNLQNTDWSKKLTGNAWVISRLSRLFLRLFLSRVTPFPVTPFRKAEIAPRF